MLETIVDTAADDDVGLTAKVATDIAERMHDAILQATGEVFHDVIAPQAQRDSPVGTPPDDKHPGKNRDSIRTRVFDDRDKHLVTGTVYTTSGYGWLLEHGTSHNRSLTRTKISRRHGKAATDDRTPARPYLYPAVRDNAEKIIDRAREILEAESE